MKHSPSDRKWTGRSRIAQNARKMRVERMGKLQKENQNEHDS